MWQSITGSEHATVTTIKLRDVSKTIPLPDSQSGAVTEVFAVQHVDFTVPNGKVLVILGPSGCGKSTLLKIIAGLIEPDSGQVLYNGKDMIDTPPNLRQIGMVFQDYALYPQQTVKMNILSYFNFRRQHGRLSPEAQEKYRRTSELMGVEIDYLLHKKPGKLSGGERQKVAIARCITRDPDLFLMDEPFANIDQKLREQYRVQLKRLLREFGITTVYVTHDQQEALALADVIAIMNGGQIEQMGPPRALYALPRNLFVAEFLNFDQELPAINLLNGEDVSQDLVGLLVGVRPVDMSPCANLQPGPGAVVVGLQRSPLSHDIVATLRVAQRQVGLRLPPDYPIELDDRLRLCFERYHVFEPQTGKAVRHVG